MLERNLPVWKLGLISAVLLLATFSLAQLDNDPGSEPDGGGSAPLPSDEITDQQREAIWQQIDSNVARLKREGILHETSPQVTLFKWPLAKAAGLPDFNVEGISNYVDQNVAFPNQLLDYNCGSRTYDQSSGYNHRGIDIFTWPFGWKKMDNSEVLVVAAAPGTIVNKSNGNFDRSCTFTLSI